MFETRNDWKQKIETNEQFWAIEKWSRKTKNWKKKCREILKHGNVEKRQESNKRAQLNHANYLKMFQLYEVNGKS